MYSSFPLRPVQYEILRLIFRLYQGCEQLSHLRHRYGNQFLIGALVALSPFHRLISDHRQSGVGQDRRRDVPVQAIPPQHLVLVQPTSLLDFSRHSFDSPDGPCAVDRTPAGKYPERQFHNGTS